MYSQVLFCFVCLFAFFGQINASSIPMWEYLTKEEKMAYLYSMFKNQVEEYCEFSEMDDCVNELLRYGLKKLREMPENRLDEMDPYQRGASSIIWNSMMQGHESITKTTKTTTTTTAKPSIEETNAFGGEAAASAKIDNVIRVAPPKDFIFKPNTVDEVTNVEEKFESGAPLYRKPPMKFFAPPIPTIRRRPVQSGGGEGPFIVRVYPDGRPVVEEQNVVPQDEDLRQYLLAKVKLPDY